MPTSTRLPTPGPSTAPQSSKRTMSDAESAPQDSKKARRNSSPEPSTRRDSNRDAKRRRRRKRKAPVVNLAAKNEVTQSRPGERSRAPLSARNEIIRFTSAPSEADLSSIVPATKCSSQAPSSKPSSKSREGSSHFPDDITEHHCQGMPSTLVCTTIPSIRRNAYVPNRMPRSGLFQQTNLYLGPPSAHWKTRWLNSRQSSNPRTVSVVSCLCFIISLIPFS